jgi:sphinganine-1-phosphate aldolase
VLVDIDPQTFKVRAEDMEKTITENTILLVASAPSYSQGVIDPIKEIGTIAQKHNLLFHVDACVGGVHLSFMRKLGYSIPDFDFSVPGVTSISTDLHKYGYAAKGCSVIMYRSKDLRKYQIFACTDTTGYTLINPTMLSSKSGGPFAGAWAVLNYLGEEGYMRNIRTVQEVQKTNWTVSTPSLNCACWANPPCACSPSHRMRSTSINWRMKWQNAAGTFRDNSPRL